MEAKFQRDLETFRAEAQSGAQHLYSFLTIHAILAERRDILDAVNENPLFWKTCLAAFQTSFFIILGRVFDTNSRHNLFALLEYAEDHPEIFSLDALEARKRAASPNADEWIDEYLATAHVPTHRDFERLRKRAKHYERIYRKGYKRIRNKIYAHKELSDDASVQSLFSNTRVRELENTFVYLNKVHESLWQLFINEREPRLQPMPYSVNSIRKTKFPEHHSTEVQEQIVKETLSTLEMVASPN